MAHLIACLGSGTGIVELNKIIQSEMFDKIYLITTELEAKNYIKPEVKQGINITLIKLNFENALEDLVPELYVILKRYFIQDKVQDLDMAVNITSGTGKEHSILISTLIKLGYGIRLVDLDKNGNILEMI